MNTTPYRFSYVVVISDNEYICQNCMKLFNRLDLIESETKTLKFKALKQIKSKYCDGKLLQVLPKETYQELCTKNNLSNVNIIKINLNNNLLK